MTIGIIRHWHVGNQRPALVLSMAIDSPGFALGFVIHTWGVRLMLLRWHVCFHWIDEGRTT